jgi:hypothetical protein
MKYLYLGKEVEVQRISEASNTAQLSDGSWVPLSMLVPIGETQPQEPPTTQPAEEQSKRRSRKAEDN